MRIKISHKSQFPHTPVDDVVGITFVFFRKMRFESTLVCHFNLPYKYNIKIFIEDNIKHA
jgi:hypothetical protein